MATHTVAAPLPRVPAADVKRRGWRGVMDIVRTEGAALITNHDRPEAVILSPQVYGALIEAQQALEARADADLATLRRRFDERLAALREPKAGDRLRSVMREPAQLRGRVKAGTGH
jgi:PHD/YefM family antitoxin component YafN of YafNO toxin-antitoxin module